MENKKDTFKQLMFLEPVTKDTDTEQLLETIVMKLESFGFKIIDREEEQKGES